MYSQQAILSGVEILINLQTTEKVGLYRVRANASMEWGKSYYLESYVFIRERERDIL